MPKANRRDPAHTVFSNPVFFPPFPWQQSWALCLALLLLSPAPAGALPVPISGATGKCSLAKCFCPWLRSAFPSWVKTRLVPTPGCICPRLGSHQSLCSPKCSLIISPNNCVIASTEVFQMPKLILLFMPSFISNGILITLHIQKYWIDSA